MKLVAALVMVASAAALAEEPKKPSAEEQAMMEKYVKAGTPGPEHQQMAKLAGKWKMQVTSWMQPGAPPMKSEGTAEYRTILGGRYLEGEAHGDMGGQPFEGRALEGYDNVTGERFGTWIDSMSTTAMLLKGKCRAAAKKCTMSGKVSDPMAGKPVTVTTITTVKDDDHFVMEMLAPGPGGKPFKTMEIVYTRAQ